MAQAGFQSLFLGLESTNPRQLKQISKTFTSLETVQQWIYAFKEKGVYAAVSLIVGLPGWRVSDTATDVANLIYRAIPFWSNPYYMIPGSTDYKRAYQADPEGISRVLLSSDQYGFMLPYSYGKRQELYWSWVYAQACAQWTKFILRIDLSRSQVGLLDVAQEFIEYCWRDNLEHSATAGVNARPSWAVEDGDMLVVGVKGCDCFCGVQLPRKSHQSHINPIGYCLPSGDMIAAVLSIARGIPLESREQKCSLGGKSEFCEFRISQRRLGIETHDAFIVALEEIR